MMVEKQAFLTQGLHCFALSDESADSAPVKTDTSPTGHRQTKKHKQATDLKQNTYQAHRN
jgi:hypothetical protein